MMPRTSASNNRPAAKQILNHDLQRLPSHQPSLPPLFRTPLFIMGVFVCASLTALPAVHGCAIGIKDGELVCARPAEPGTPWVGDCLFTGAGERACVSRLFLSFSLFPLPTPPHPPFELFGAPVSLPRILPPPFVFPAPLFFCCLAEDDKYSLLR